MVDGFLANFAAVAHAVDVTWEVDGAAVTEGRVTYTGHDGRSTTLPFCNVLHLADDGRIRVDNTIEGRMARLQAQLQQRILERLLPSGFDTGNIFGG